MTMLTAIVSHYVNLGFPRFNYKWISDRKNLYFLILIFKNK